jgi:acyl carrier protein
MNQSTLERLRTLVVKKFDVDPALLADDRHISELGMDSLGMADFVFHVEDLFGVEIDFDKAMANPTLSGFASLVDQLCTTKSEVATV